MRPAGEDLDIVTQALAGQQHVKNALVLGVTPDYAGLAWPAGTQLFALDRTFPMIGLVWPRAAGPVACGDWQKMPLARASIDVALGDGCATTLAYPEGCRAFFAELRRVLSPSGLLVLRCFVRPDEPEAPAAVFEALRAKRIGSFHYFKWRLVTSLQASPEEGVRLGAVWERWKQEVPDAEALAREQGWPADLVQGIDAYRDVAARYSFPTLDEMKRVLAPGFRLRACRFAGYELAERFPTLLAEPA